MLVIQPVLIGEDNYSYIITDNETAVVLDPSDSDPILQFLETKKIRLTYVLITHHHGDHTGGLATIKRLSSCKVISSDNRVHGTDLVVGDNYNLDVVLTGLTVLHVPGHTKTSVAYYLQKEKAVFTGDTLFNAGCGRISESTSDAMYHSLQKIVSLPDDTKIYCGHEYTLDNCRFALTVEPSNRDLQDRFAHVTELYKKGIPTTVPSSVDLEKRTNPFVRAESKEIRKNLDMIGRSPVAVFAQLRSMKNNF